MSLRLEHSWFRCPSRACRRARARAQHPVVDHPGARQKRSVVYRDRHMYVRLTHKLADLIGLVANTSVNGNDLHLRSISLVDLLEAGHLSAARNTVGRPELEVYRLLAIVVNDVDRAAINRAQRDVGRRLANQLGQ